MEETQVYDFQNASINILNDDCLKHIFQFLPIVDKMRIERVCKRWRVLSKDSWYTMKEIDTSWIYEISDFLTYHRFAEVILKKIEKMLPKYGKFITKLHLPHPATMSTLGYNIREFNEKLFKIVMKYCTNLTNINISITIIDEEDEQIFLCKCKKITRLTLGVFYDLDEQKTFFQEFPQLNYLQIFCNDNFTGECISYLPAQTMRTLIVRCCSNIEDIIFSKGLAKLENLEHLEITCSTIGRKMMRTISKYSEKLKILRINKHNSWRSGAALRFTNLINLQTLKLTYFPFSPKHFTEIASNCQQITSLDISGSSFCDDTALRTIAALPKLEYLNISFVLGITDNGLKNLKNLKGLECSGCENITDNGIHDILVFSPQLQLLDLSFCSRITNNIFEFAKVIRDNEPNKIVLKIYISGTQIVLTDKHKVHPAIQLITFTELYVPGHLLGRLPVKYMPLSYPSKQCGFYINWREQTKMREAILRTSTNGYPFAECCRCHFK
ncbi:F-box/LRR-repeat protein 2-like [Odontomachus brunneus]|uniref:F-box/LRR-repeat protein 2-like n=1 Tax=Odontomachus brunneus TaxID=486640 RepID=UPI0013F1884C|nr:F-box/LRR-repeat protein 2-like [Odontomachus brunneus]